MKISLVIATLSLLSLCIQARVQAPTTCQLVSYLNQEVQCPQMKDANYYYTNSELATICSVCGGSLPGFSSTDIYCCPQGYTVLYNGSAQDCFCNTTQLKCANCGYSQTSVTGYCQTIPALYQNQVIFSSFARTHWACPSTWGSPTQDVDGWTCSCGMTGIPCMACSVSGIARHSSFLGLLMTSLLEISFEHNNVF